MFPDPASRQTRPVEGGHYAELIKQSIGEFHFLAAFEDREMRINEPDRLFGSVIVSESMFADLWQCARTPNCKFHSVFFDVFGERMQDVKSYGRTEFNWTVPEPSRFGLHIASFSYRAGQGKYEAGTA